METHGVAPVCGEVAYLPGVAGLVRAQPTEVAPNELQ